MKTHQSKITQTDQKGSAILHVLIIEDDPSDAYLVQRMLSQSNESLNTFKTNTADKLSAAFDLLNKENFDVVLLDLNLPDAVGLEALYELNVRLPKLPVIILTGLEDEKVALEAAQKGAEDYLIKSQLSGSLIKRSINYAVIRKQFDDLESENKEKEKHLHELEKALASQRNLTGWQESSITAELSGIGPMKVRNLQEFNLLSNTYADLLDKYIESLGFNSPQPKEEINSLAKDIGDFGGGPRDVVDLHLFTVEKKCKGIAPKQATALTTEGRLLALEVMGQLVDYYRLRNLT